MNYENDDMFGHKVSEKQFGKDGLIGGELVDILLIEKTHPAKYLEELSKRNTEAKAKADGLGKEFIEEKPSFKESGVLWRYAVIFRSRTEEEPFEAVFKPNDSSELQEPGYICYGQITVYPPKVLLENKWNFQQMGGSVKCNKQNDPYVVEILPNSTPCRDRDTGVTADKIPAGQEEKFQGLIEKEKQRLFDWSSVIEAYNEMTEESASAMLDKWFAKKYLLCHFYAEKNIYIYVKPEVGIMFRAAIKSGTSKYLDLKIFQWDSERKVYDFYSGFNTYQVEPENLALAKKIVDLKQRMREKFAKDKASKDSSVAQEDYKEHLEDEVPVW